MKTKLIYSYFFSFKSKTILTVNWTIFPTLVIRYTFEEVIKIILIKAKIGNHQL